jgi:Holliday junction resolvase RusA-like endonuclease
MKAEFWVAGQPVAKGSLRPVPKGGARPFVVRGDRHWQIKDLVMLPQNRGLDAWMKAIAAASLEFAPPSALEGPWSVEIVCYLPRAEKAKPLDATYHTSKRGPDADKLLRSVMDALEKIYWINDGHVSRSLCEKRWDDGRGPGAQITVELLAKRQSLFT